MKDRKTAIWGMEGRFSDTHLLGLPLLSTECHLQSLTHQSFVRKWLLPNCLPVGLPCPAPP
jgi:hypothetical protein